MVSTKQDSRSDIESGTQTAILSLEKEPLVAENGVSKWGKLFSGELTVGFLWCVCSFSMILTNKLLASAFSFRAPIALLLFQFLTTVMLIDVAGKLEMIKRDPLEWRVMKIWWPLNVIFVGMIATGFFTLKTLQVPMVTLLKNLTNLLTIFGDMYFFGKRYAIGVWVSLGLMAVSALVGSCTDLSFRSSGYTWQFLNCLCTAAYALYLKKVLNQVSEVASEKGGISDITKVYYNHLLGLPWLCLLMISFGETNGLLEQPALRNPYFLLAAAFSGVVGFAVSYTSIRFMSMTTATTYVMTGSLNKIPTAVLGWLLFRVKTTVVNVISVLVGLCAGVIFVRAKAAEKI